MPSNVETATDRTEAFSDGVFAVAITLLVLDIKVPNPSALVQGELGKSLLAQWPSILAFVISFFYILIGWINHHRIFALIRKVDGALLILNGYLLLTFVAFPFSASLLATYIQTPHAKVATLVYSGLNLLIAMGFRVVWNYASHNHRLIRHDVPASVVKAISGQYNTTLPFFISAVVLAYFWPPVSIGLSVAIILFYTITGFTFPESDGP
jgi:uncharacterized membrane protein